MYKSAMDESAHLMNELTHAAEAARRTAVKLRGRETGEPVGAARSLGEGQRW